MVDRNFFDPRAGNSRGRAGFDPLAIKAASEDQRLGFDMLMNYLTGTTDTGTGPFAGFLEDFFAPLATSAINAIAMGGGQMPTSIDDLFGMIQDGIGGGATTNIYDDLKGLAEQAIASKLGPGANISYDELQAVLGTLNPLVTLGMDKIGASQFRRQQGDTLRREQAPSYWDMTGQNNRKDWGDFFTNSPFYQQYFGDAPTSSMSPVVAGARANSNNSLNVDPAAQRRTQRGGGGGSGGLFVP